ncbi:major facilitator superfamily MFS_1 [Xylanimonas cellulosilytica DSM 15894]|uniref:Major facilitator superfamily MFS_1 n=1 Tax=Xylanimonas cellulosilytica (strain DSM 15894 / JCM 12276 / CECT 5975 / KCTC 9989 / LMG 20990 / NBRC 107835 / XIL07) TaxID=446471 RepID=D1BUM4_XYLCX|nr:MFS transporter [Xylanimonas cellulosilytica]ACZ29265.1 major facilitator superfamily MFS_1 [Xylanimonas cellulosilytica DSM 15894]
MPSSPSPSAVPSAARRARVAVSAVFLVNAVLYANVVPRLPEVKADLGLSNAALGAAIAAMPLGALLAGLLAPALIQRFGSAGVASFGLVALAGAVAAIPLAGAWVVLAGLFLLAGALDAVIDVAQNAHGFRVQRLYGRSIVNAFHGLWSVGAVLGGLIGSAAAGLSIPLSVHVATTSAVFSVVAVVAFRFLLRGPEDAERPDDGGAHGHGSRPLRHVAGRTILLLAALGAIAAGAAFVEDAGSSWGALYLRTELGAGAAAAGLAFVALQVAMTVGRLTGDRAVDRFGQRRVARVGGVAIAVGMGFALAVPSLASTLVGFALAGLGVATLVPAVMHTADELPGLPAGVGLTVVSWLLRVGFLVSPAAVGLVADATSLRVGLLGVVGAGVLVAVVGRVLLAGPAAGDDEPITASGGPAASPST